MSELGGDGGGVLIPCYKVTLHFPDKMDADYIESRIQIQFMRLISPNDSGEKG